MEDLIIEAFYEGLIAGALNQRDSVLEVRSAVGRDIAPGDVQGMIGRLSTWYFSLLLVLITLLIRLMIPKAQTVRIVDEIPVGAEERVGQAESRS